MNMGFSAPLMVSETPSWGLRGVAMNSACVNTYSPTTLGGRPEMRPLTSDDLDGIKAEHSG
jgi:hypothetical protein